MTSKTLPGHYDFVGISHPVGMQTNLLCKLIEFHEFNEIYIDFTYFEKSNENIYFHIPGAVVVPAPPGV